VGTADVRVTVRVPVAVDDAARCSAAGPRTVDVLANDRFATGFELRPAGAVPRHRDAPELRRRPVQRPTRASPAPTGFPLRAGRREGAVVARPTCASPSASSTPATTPPPPSAASAPRIRVLANDDVVTGVTVRLVQPPAHGTTTLRADGRVDYVPAAGFTGTDRFPVRAHRRRPRGRPLDLDLAR
jgi:hypothetical protein